MGELAVDRPEGKQEIDVLRDVLPVALVQTKGYAKCQRAEEND